MAVFAANFFARRQIVNAKPGKVPVSSKAKAKAVVAKSKPAVKAVVKPVSKGSKPAAKPVAKTAPVKSSPSAAKKKPAPPAASKSVKPVKPAAKAGKPVKPVPATAKSAAKKPAQPVAKPPVKPVATQIAQAMTKPKATPVAKPAATPVAKPAVKAPPPKASRASSRYAPSSPSPMAEVVTSLTAKSSYAPIMSSPVIVAPLPSAQKKDPKLANNWKTKPANELTDAELLAMPDSEYMNEKQLGAFRARLQQLKQDILTSAGATTEHMREDTVVVPDPADRATIEEEHALELRTRDRERKLLKKIEQSLALIDSGDYGYCDETGEPIGVGRLLARPTATLTLEAQQRRELRQRMFGD
jgi:DnaK suppressor protein